MNCRRLGIFTIVLFSAAVASAAITPIGEFTGDLQEGFENIYSPGAYPGPIPFFGGFATMDDSLAHTVVIAYFWTGQGGDVYPYNGNLFAGGVAGSEIITFSSPIQQFGGFFTTVGPNPDGSVIFRDETGATIDTLSMSVTPTQWGWQGWTSDVPFKSIEIIGNNVPGCSTQLDDLQMSYVPEPAALGLIVLGAGLLMRRR